MDNMVKIRGILNAIKMILLAHDQGQSYIKSKLHFFTSCMWCYDGIPVTKYVIMTS